MWTPNPRQNNELSSIHGHYNSNGSVHPIIPSSSSWWFQKDRFRWFRKAGLRFISFCPHGARGSASRGPGHHGGPLLKDPREGFCSVLQQSIKDGVSQLHLDRQLVFIVVDPLSFLFLKLLNLKHKFKEKTINVSRFFGSHRES